ncbi:hypothetical protein B7463_g2268, partial [Scytalidium lignicola]
MPTILVSGANKGIGRGFVAKYLSRPQTTVIATVRNLSSPDAKSLDTLPKAEGSKLIVVKVEVTSDADAAAAVASLAAHGVSSLDVVIANAGIFKVAAFNKVAEAKPSDLLEHADVNGAGVIRLFQATWPLLQKATEPKFVVMSSVIASLGAMEHIPFTCLSYGASKAMANYIVRRIHFENEGLIAFPIFPGSVQTDEGNAAARVFGLPEAYITVEHSVDSMIAKASSIDKATKAETSGKFLSFDDSPMLW